MKIRKVIDDQTRFANDLIGQVRDFYSQYGVAGDMAKSIVESLEIIKIHDILVNNLDNNKCNVIFGLYIAQELT